MREPLDTTLDRSAKAPHPGVEATRARRPYPEFVEQNSTNSESDAENEEGGEQIAENSEEENSVPDDPYQNFDQSGVIPEVRPEVKTLTPHELNFVYYFISVSNFNAVDAWARATEGASKIVLGRVGAGDVLARPHVQDAIRDVMARRADELKISADHVLDEIASIAFLDLADLVDNQGNLKPLSQIPPHARRAIAALEFEESWKGKKQVVRVHDKLKALELLGRYLKLFKDELKVSVSYEEIVRQSIEEGPKAQQLEGFVPRGELSAADAEIEAQVIGKKGDK